MKNPYLLSIYHESLPDAPPRSSYLSVGIRIAQSQINIYRIVFAENCLQESDEISHMLPLYGECKTPEWLSCNCNNNAGLE